MSKQRKSISPVIATVIIVAVAISIAIAVAFWMSGIVGLFTRNERVEVLNAYADWNETLKTWMVVLHLRNSGSSDATIDEIFINGRPHDSWASLTNNQYAYIANARVALNANDLKENGTVPTGNSYPYIDGGTSGNITLNSASTKLSGKTVQLFDFTNGVPLKAGSEMTIILLIPGPGIDTSVLPGYTGGVDFKHGSSIEIKVHTAGGREYPKEVPLP